MKYIQYLFCFLMLVLSVVSCDKHVNKGKLSMLRGIKIMGDTIPTKALLRLDSIRPHFDNESEYMRNKFALLDIRLRDKAFITHKSDSVIKNVCCYFEENGSAAERQEAYYYMASVYRDLNDYPNAVTNFLKAIDIAEKNEDTDSYILQVSYTQLAYMYGEQFNYSEALEAMLKGLEVAEKHGNATERTYMSVAGFYYDLKDTVNTLLFLYQGNGNCGEEGGW